MAAAGTRGELEDSGGCELRQDLEHEFPVGTLVRKQADVDQLKSPHRSPAMTLKA